MASSTHNRVTHRRRVSYIDRSRDYYQAQGYDQAYQWAAAREVPLTQPQKPRAEWRVAAVTTAAVDPEAATKIFAAPSSPIPESLHTNHLSWHKEVTNTDDVGAYLPLSHLTALAADGSIGSVGPRFFGVPTLYSHGRTLRNAEEVAAWCIEDEIDIAVLSGL